MFCEIVFCDCNLPHINGNTDFAVVNVLMVTIHAISSFQKYHNELKSQIKFIEIHTFIIQRIFYIPYQAET
jgi:hypothetical protein